MNILDQLIENNFFILGGEIYNKEFWLLWSWECDKKPQQNQEDYLIESEQMARRYINNTDWLESAHFFPLPQTFFDVGWCTCVTAAGITLRNLSSLTEAIRATNTL